MNVFFLFLAVVMFCLETSDLSEISVMVSWWVAGGGGAIPRMVCRVWRDSGCHLRYKEPSEKGHNTLLVDLYVWYYIKYAISKYFWTEQTSLQFILD